MRVTRPVKMKFDTTPMDLLTRLDTQQAQTGILGLGYVGLPLMLRYAEVGYLPGSAGLA